MIEILTTLRSHANPANVAGMARYGINSNGTLGVPVHVLRRLAKEHRRQHNLALELWDTGIHEARIIATLVDDPALVTAETEALTAAERIVTPHTEIAALFGARAVLLDWIKPKPLTHIVAPAAKRVAFVGPTIARKGAFELCAAAKALDLEIVPLGSALEGADFWSGVRTALPDPANWLNGVPMVDFTDPKASSFDGTIALQLHAGGRGNMEFKDIWIRDLSKR